MELTDLSNGRIHIEKPNSLPKQMYKEAEVSRKSNTRRACLRTYIGLKRRIFDKLLWRCFIYIYIYSDDSGVRPRYLWEPHDPYSMAYSI